MTHSYVWHDSFICVTWLIHMCDMTHSYVWHDSFICVTWLIHACDMTCWFECSLRARLGCILYVWRESFICVTWFTHMCDMTHSECAPESHSHSAFYVCDMNHSYVWYDSLICVTWLTHRCDETHHYVCPCTIPPERDSSCHTYEWVMSHIWVSHVTHMSESCHTYEWFTSHI